MQPPPTPPHPPGPPIRPPTPPPAHGLSAERAARAEATFSEALDLPEAERAAFITRQCGDDAELAAHVRRLLAAHERAAGFLEDDAPLSPEIEEQLARLKPEEEGELIGPYKLREQIGEGGFGTVWVADQDKPVRRRVALKILKMGMDTKEVIARFEQERQALALMEHPNIAKVLDAGATQFGRPFFVMELVRGVKITDYCDEQQLSTQERIELFITVCQAVQHAHQKGIIHRDLKPSNILVTINDGKAVPKVIDFGVAKATQGRLTEQTVYTQFQQMIGTPLYMSPEQAEMTSLDIDTRSDIYALGVLLYELLTGHTPIDQDTVARVGMDELRRLIREVDPPRPSMRLKTLAGDELTTMAKRRHTEPAKLPGTLRGDVDWIVMKCLEKDRQRRYDTANGLALDLQRYLKNEVVIARPPTTTYLLSKLIRRNKLVFVAGAAVAASLVIGLAASVWQAVRAEREATRAKSAEQRATADEQKATAAEAVAKAEAGRATNAEAVAVQEKEIARQALAKSQLDLAEKEFERGKFDEAQKILNETPESFRDANWRFLRTHSRDFTARLSIPGRGSVHQLQFLPQGDRFAATCFYNLIGVFTLTGQQIGDWVPAVGDAANTFGIDRAGGRLAYAASPSEVVVQEVATGQVLRRWTCDSGTNKNVLLSPDGGTVIVAGGKQLSAHAAQTGAPLWTQPFTGVVPALSADGRSLAVLAAKSGLALKVHLLDPLTGAVLKTLEAIADNPDKTTLQFNRTGDRLACYGGDEVIFWNPQTAEKMRALHFPGEEVRLLRPAGDVVVTCNGSRIRLWEAATGRLLRSLNGAGTEIKNLTFNADGNVLLSAHHGTNDGIVCVWPVRLGEEIASARLGSSGRASRVVFNREGARFYACANTAGAWESRGGRETWRFSPATPNVLQMDLHPTDGSILLSEWGHVKFTHLSSVGEKLEAFGASHDESVKFSRSGQLALSVEVAFSQINPGRSFSVMEYPSGKVLRKIELENPRQPFAAFCLDEAAVATAARAGGITVWDWKAGTRLRQIAAAQTGSIACLASSPDGRRLASGGLDRWVRVWDAVTGHLEVAFRAHWETVRCVVFSPDGREIVSGSEDGIVRVHDAATGEERLTLYGLTAPVGGVDFSPDGTLVAAIATDGVAKVWDRKLSSAPALLPK
ncbi:MAG: serine/threonine-protein kinase [Chthoniobacteraceae bacterium]